MSLSKHLRASFAALGLAAAGVALGACSSDDPTAPTPGGGGVPPGGGTPSTTWNITVTANPSELTLPAEGSADPVPTSTIQITVRNASTGQPPPNGTTVVVQASGGVLNGGVTSGAVELVNGQAVLQFTPTSAGTAAVVARLESSAGQALINVVAAGEEPPFVLSHVEPSVGDPAGGQAVNIVGQNIEEPVRVLFGGNVAEVLSVSSTRIRVRVPPAPAAVPVGSTLPVTITVTSGFGTTEAVTDSLANGFVYAHGGSVAQPQIFSVTPTTGPQQGGTPITINGTGFQSPVQVLFIVPTAGGNIELEAPVQNVTGSQVVVISPDIRSYVQAGTLVEPVTATIRLVNLSSGFQATAGQQFFYGASIRITAIAPAAGRFDEFTTVTIHGSGFDEPVAVSFEFPGGVGTVTPQIISVTGSQIIVRMPPVTGVDCDQRLASSRMTVVNIEGGASATGPAFTYIGPPSPLIRGISPNAGAVGTTVTISGSNFPTNLNNVRVLFGGPDGATAAVTSTSATSIVARVPTPPAEFTFNTEPCDANGDGLANGTRNIPTPIDVTVRNVETGCEDTLSRAFTLTPQNTTCTGDTTPAPPTAQCADGIDNDGDGLVDFGPNPTNDPQCTSATDNDESA